ncbi:MAG: GDSL-type esterase/lipase family protein [Opitutae bacterium]
MRSSRKLLQITCSCLVLAFCPEIFSEQVNPDPNRFKKAFNEFNQADKSSPHASKELVLFTGSSSIRFWNLQKFFPKLNAINRGFGGAHLSDVLHFYDQLFPKYRPSMIVLYCGENDLWSGKTVPQVKKDFLELWSRIDTDLPDVKLIYLSCKPSPKRISKWELYQDLNQRIKKFSEAEKNLTFIDISSTLLQSGLNFYDGFWRTDNLHLNDRGYEQWTKRLKPYLRATKNP